MRWLEGAGNNPGVFLTGCLLTAILLAVLLGLSRVRKQKRQHKERVSKGEEHE